MQDTRSRTEKAFLVAFDKKGADREANQEHLNELESLASTAGAEVINTYYQELDSPSPSTAIGKGKVEEIEQDLAENDVHLVIFDNDLTPVQLKNLERIFKVKVIDRCGLILDIFAKHAKTLEAKTQVELAQYQYLLPRLSGMWTHLSKQYGGIRTKGPGETQVETDRRIVRLKIRSLKEKLVDISSQREQQRKGRGNIAKFALVGYTNAGKSTLMKAITDSEVLIEDKLFATLDTTVRSFALPTGMKAVLSDTVGFIRKLPPHLVASFRSTLAEVTEADIIVHVVDISNKFFREHIKVVENTLEQLKVGSKPMITVFNKVDILEDRDELRAIESEFKNSIFISAARSINILALLDKFQIVLNESGIIWSLMIPYNSMEAISKLYNLTEILERNDSDDGINFTIKVSNEKSELFRFHFSKYMVQSNGN